MRLRGYNAVEAVTGTQKEYALVSTGFSKAFDSVKHSVLLENAEKLGDGSAYALIRS